MEGCLYLELTASAIISAKPVVTRSQSQLASLLVQTTPSRVRQAFLRSTSVEDSTLVRPPSPSPVDSHQVRWSGNWECVNGGSGQSSDFFLSSAVEERGLTGSNPDISSESKTSKLVQSLMTSRLEDDEDQQQSYSVDGAVAGTLLSQNDEGKPEAVLDGSGAEDMVTLFADRLCAITHGFFLHCSCEAVLQQRQHLSRVYIWYL